MAAPMGELGPLALACRLVSQGMISHLTPQLLFLCCRAHTRPFQLQVILLVYSTPVLFVRA